MTHHHDMAIHQDALRYEKIRRLTAIQTCEMGVKERAAWDRLMGKRLDALGPLLDALEYVEAENIKHPALDANRYAKVRWLLSLPAHRRSPTERAALSRIKRGGWWTVDLDDAVDAVAGGAVAGGA